MFKLLAAALGMGVVAGLIARGRFRNLREIRLWWTPVLFVALIIGLIPLFVGVPKGPRIALQIVSMLGVLAFLAINTARARGGVRIGFWTIAMGWALNFIVIAANGGMPLSRWAYSKIESGPITPGRGGFFKIVIAGPHSVLRPLGDVIPLRAVDQVLSIGDVVLIIGIVVVIAAGMRARASTAEATTG